LTDRNERMSSEDRRLTSRRVMAAQVPGGVTGGYMCSGRTGNRMRLRRRQSGLAGVEVRGPRLSKWGRKDSERRRREPVGGTTLVHSR
jgi:hypothetical protein